MRRCARAVCVPAMLAASVQLRVTQVLTLTGRADSPVPCSAHQHTDVIYWMLLTHHQQTVYAPEALTGAKQVANVQGPVRVSLRNGMRSRQQHARTALKSVLGCRCAIARCPSSKVPTSWCRCESPGVDVSAEPFWSLPVLHGHCTSARSQQAFAEPPRVRATVMWRAKLVAVVLRDLSM